MKFEREREPVWAALIAFVVTATGLTLSGVGSAFRGVVARAPAMIAAFRRRPDDLSLLLA